MQYHVAVVDARYRVFVTDHGTDRHYTGPAFELPRPAIDYAKALAATTAGRGAENDQGVAPDGGPRSEPAVLGRPGASYSERRPTPRSGHDDSPRRARIGSPEGSTPARSATPVGAG